MSDLYLDRGDDATRVVTITNRITGEPVDITTISHARFTAKRRRSDADDDAVIGPKDLGSGVEITDGPAGELTVTFEQADTDDIDEVTVLKWDCQVTDAAGVVTTVVKGRLLIEPDVTRVSP